MSSNIGNIIIINLILIYQCLAQTCQSNQIFNFLSKSCIDCSPVCENCFNIGEQSCIGCSQNSYLSYDNVSMCKNQCQKNEFIDIENKRCIKCNVVGCVQCTSQQICLACDTFLKLDTKNNSCNLKKDICQSNYQFLIPPLTDTQCADVCPTSYYQNYFNQLCEQTQECPQVLQFSSLKIHLNITQIGFINNDQYILMSETSSSFDIVDANLQVLAKFELFENRDDDDHDIQNQCFQEGIYGGCLQEYRFKVMNFDTLQIEFNESHLEYKYNILYVDDINQLVFMKADQVRSLVWYDMRNKKINSIQIQFSNYILFKILDRYYVQALEVNSLLIGTLCEDYSISIDDSKSFFSIIPNKLLLEKKHYALSYTFLKNRNNFYKIQFELDGQIKDQILIFQIESFPSYIFSCQSLDYVVQYDLNSNNMWFIQFNDTYDGVLINQLISNQFFKFITYKENIALNSFYILTETQDQFLFANLTKSLMNFQFNKNKIIVYYKQIKKTFLNYNIFGFLQKKNEIQFFFRKQNQSLQYEVYNSLIRVRYLQSSQSFHQEYFNPNQLFYFYKQSNKRIINDMKNSFPILPENRIILQANQDGQRPQFYQINNSYLLQKVIISKQNIIFYLNNLQRNAKILTTPQKFQPIKKTEQNINRLVGNQYLIISVPESLGIISEQILDIYTQQAILSYYLETLNEKSTFCFIQSKRFLIIQNIFLIIDLDRQEIFANLTNIQGSFIVVQDSFLIILNFQDQSLYRFDLVNANLVKIFTFSPSQNFVDFMLIDQNSKYPVIINDDLIYLQDKDYSFQPFSINQQILKYQLVSLGTFYQSQFIVSQISKEILMIGQNKIQSYTFDLQYIGIILQGDNISNVYYDGNLIFFFQKDFFYKFDPITKQLLKLKIKNSSVNSQFEALEQNFYRLDDSSYFKKSNDIIDAKNMIIVKTQQEDNTYIGQIQQDDTQIHFFQSQNDFYWYKNLFNNPYRVLNLQIQTQIFLAQQLNNNLYWIAIYDKGTNQIIIYNKTDVFKIIQISFSLQFDLTVYVLNWTSFQLIYVNSDTLYLYSPLYATQIKQISILDSKITLYKVCSLQNIIVALTSQNMIYSINIQDGSKVQINLSQINCKTQVDISLIQFDLDCYQNLIILIQPCFQVYDQITGKQVFNKFLSQYLGVVLSCNPIVNIQKQIFAIFSQENQIQISQQEQYQKIIYQNTSSKYGQSIAFYDFDKDIYILLTGLQKYILIINIFSNKYFFTYTTKDYFDNNSVYFSRENQSLIIVDNSPIIYLYNFQTSQIQLFEIQVYQTKGIIMDELKQIIFLYSTQYIHVYQYPQMKFIESFSLQQYDLAQILNIYLNTQFNLLIVQTQDSFISFDLTEILYSSETNLVQFQYCQNIVINEEYQIYYFSANYSINLFNQETLKDYLILIEDQHNIQPYLVELFFFQLNKQLFYINLYYIYYIKVDLQNQKLTLLSKTQLYQNPINYFFKLPYIYGGIMQVFYQQNLLTNSIEIINGEFIEQLGFNFPDSDLSKALICGQYILAPSIKKIYIKIFYDDLNSIDLKNESMFQFMLKLQSKDKENYKNNWWKIPFDYEERNNINDFSDFPENVQITNLICIISYTSQDTIIQILDVTTYNIIKYIVLQQTKVTNIVNDPFRKLIYAVLNKGQTNIYDWDLNLLISLENSCFKQAAITFDFSFIYSVCPTDIIIYNGLNFQQQFPVINYGIKEAVNIISVNYNNYFIIIEKENIKLIQLKQNSKYQVLFFKKNKYYQVQVLKLLKNQDDQSRLLLVLSSQLNVEKIIIPLSPNNKCNLIIQQQNAYQGNFQIQGMIKQTLSNFQNFKIDTTLKVVEITYLNEQCITQISQQFNYTQLNLALSLINKSASKYSKICWQNNITYNSEIVNLYITQMTLSVDSVNLNQNSFMKTFQMNNITLNINNSLILQNFEKVYLTNINIQAQENQMTGQLTINNCQLVLIKNLNISEIFNQQNIQFNLINNTQVEIDTVQISSEDIRQLMGIQINLQSIFRTNNNTNLIIRSIKVIGLSNKQVFELNNSQYLEAFDINILQSQNIQFFNVQLIQNSNLTNVKIQNIINSTFFNVMFSASTYINSIQVMNSSSLTLINQQNLETDDISFICQQLKIKDINIINSNQTSIQLQVNSIQINNINITQMYTDSHIISISAKKLQIDQLQMNQINYLSNKYQNQIALNLFNIQSFTIQNAHFVNNSIAFLSVSHQQLQNNHQYQITQIQIIKSQFLKNQINSESSLIHLNNLDQIELNQVTLKLNMLNKNIDSSFIQISQCQNVTISNSVFDDNINSNGNGGALYLIDILKVQIYNSKFISNKCLQKNGGAINFVNKQFIGILNIDYSQFVVNQAFMSTGGAINLIKVNLILQNSQIESNIAQIGGGIYYSQIVPDFILLQQKGLELNNTIQNNYANIYGRNLGSTLRKIVISKQDIIIGNSVEIDQNQNKFEVYGIQSGEEIIFKKIQLMDEEGTPIYIPPIQSKSDLSDDVLFLIKQINIQITCDEQNFQIQCISNLLSSDYQNDGFSLAVKPMYKPLSTMLINIQSNIFPKLIDSKNNIVISQGQLQIEIQLNFQQCQIGYIQKQIINSIVCEFCSTGTYSFNIFDTQCKKCPVSAISCKGSKISLKEGYWRESDLSDRIFYCDFNPEVCKSQSLESKFNCVKGYVGRLCNSCDTYGKIWDVQYAEQFIPRQCHTCQDNTLNIILNNLLKNFFIMAHIFLIVLNLQKQLYFKIVGHYIKNSGILFLRKTCKSQRSQIFSKILCDHLQTLSIICGCFNSFILFQVPVQILGNPLQSINKSIDCLYGKYPNLQPLWFYQLLWSLLQPLLVICLYFLIGYIFLKLKQPFIIRHAKVTLVFIYFYYFTSINTILIKSMNCVQIGDKKYMDLDYNIQCYDTYYHLIYIFTFSLPLLLTYSIIIPIIFFVKAYLVQIINVLMSLNFFLVEKLKPYIQQSYNNFSQISTLLSILALNLSYVFHNSAEYKLLQIITLMLIILSNLYLFLRLTFGMMIIQVKKNIKENNLIQNILFKLKQNYPNIFDNIQIVSNQKIRALIKLKAVQRKFRILLKFLKGYNFYNEEQFRAEFNLLTEFLNQPKIKKDRQNRRDTSMSLQAHSMKSKQIKNSSNQSLQISLDSYQKLKRKSDQQQLRMSKINFQIPHYDFSLQQNSNIFLKSKQNVSKFEMSSTKDLNIQQNKQSIFELQDFSEKKNKK
ncbi:hypothetical protein ABPG74_006705 [Tetrahymena malaccensis]